LERSERKFLPSENRTAFAAVNENALLATPQAGEAPNLPRRGSVHCPRSGRGAPFCSNQKAPQNRAAPAAGDQGLSGDCGGWREAGV